MSILLVIVRYVCLAISDCTVFKKPITSINSPFNIYLHSIAGPLKLYAAYTHLNGIRIFLKACPNLMSSMI